MTKRQEFGPEDITYVVREGVPQHGGEDGKLRVIGFPARGVGGNICVHETWYDRPEGEDPISKIRFHETGIGRTSGDGLWEAWSLQLDEATEARIPREVFEAVWNKKRLVLVDLQRDFLQEATV